MTTHPHPIRTAVALSVALGALAPAAAQAKPIELMSPPPARQQPAARPIVAPAPSGFDWGDAAIGAAGAFGVAMVAAGGTVLVGGRRRRYATR
jgi:hypothetical protein